MKKIIFGVLLFLGYGLCSANSIKSYAVESDIETITSEELAAFENKTAEELFEQNEQWENEMLEDLKEETVVGDFKNPQLSRAKAGSWSWRDGVICVTDSYASSPLYNNGHAGIMATSRWYTTVEANPNDGVQFKNGDWPSRFKSNQVWQVGVTKTSVSQDQKAAAWAEKQIGKKYNKNFLNKGTRSSFYCSQLVWAAYKDTANIDLDTWRYAGAIHPFELHQTDKTTLIYRKK